VMTLIWTQLLEMLVLNFHVSCSYNKDVHQTPPHLVKNKDESAELQCSHAIQNHQVMLWYKQTEDKQLHLLGYLNTNFLYPEEALKNKIVLGGDGRNDGTLSIKSLQLNDSAVYFCAVRYTVLQNAQRFYKNLLHLHSCFNYPPTGDVGNNIVYIKWKTFILFTLFSSSPCDIYSTVMLLHLTQTV
uniref:Ig-like domain-containing protein n=1 Tax=Astyanax mexicanus TaxID=7994 RepID=A0A8B9RJ25_ASTMX